MNILQFYFYIKFINHNHKLSFSNVSCIDIYKPQIWKMTIFRNNNDHALSPYLFISNVILTILLKNLTIMTSSHKNGNCQMWQFCNVILCLGLWLFLSHKLHNYQMWLFYTEYISSVIILKCDYFAIKLFHKTQMWLTIWLDILHYHCHKSCNSHFGISLFFSPQLWYYISKFDLFLHIDSFC